MPKLYVAMYRPVTGNFEHWALYLDEEHMIYEVTGETPDFKRNIVSGSPISDSLHARSIYVYDINTIDLPTFRSSVTVVELDNSVAHWNCQDYVMEILEKLEEECVIDGEDSAYMVVKEKIKSLFGPL
ncbi:hypothetical protein MMC09_005046 [Bachmanniomyces sp. S44760]|nr:hypothetical protein [Bachmanniomyces sp. S44760]